MLRYPFLEYPVTRVKREALERRWTTAFSRGGADG